MNEARKVNQSNKIRERWAKSERYASILKLSKIDIYNEYFKICEKYKDYLDSDKIDLFKESCTIEINKYDSKRKATFEPTYIKTFDPDEIDQFSELKLILWIVKKIGSVDRVQKLLDAAKVAIEVMKE